MIAGAKYYLEIFKKSANAKCRPDRLKATSGDYVDQEQFSTQQPYEDYHLGLLLSRLGDIYRCMLVLFIFCDTTTTTLSFKLDIGFDT